MVILSLMKDSEVYFWALVERAGLGILLEFVVVVVCILFSDNRILWSG